jgi:putative ABC transport system permease protein
MNWWQIKKRDADLERELRSDLELEEDEQREAGISEGDARYAALRAFGNPDLIREQTGAVWSWNWLESFTRDLRFSLRALRRTPGFTVIAILVMALGIGANVALFTVVRGVLLKPLPFDDPDRLVMLYETAFQKDGTPGFNVVAGGVRRVEEPESQLQRSSALAGNPGRAFRFWWAITGEAE